MNQQDKKRIIFITQQLKVLAIERKRILEEESNLQQEFNSIVADKLLDLPNQVIQSTPIKEQKRKESSNKEFRDTNGNRINIGDTVSFLTKTKFKGTEGVVHRFSPKRVIARNKDNREVARTDHNLLIIKKAPEEGTSVKDDHSAENK